jgi:hypothetical protein
MTRREFAKLLRKEHRRRFGEVAPLPEDADEVIAEVQGELAFPLPEMALFLFTHAGPDFVGLVFAVGQYTDRWHPESSPSDDFWWPDKLLPIKDLGGPAWLCLDCRQKNGAMYVYREGEGEILWPDHFEQVAGSLVEFWQGFLNGAELPDATSEEV